MSTSDEHYDQGYYEANGQIGDRPALAWYATLARRYLGEGLALDVGCGTGHLLKRLAAQGGADGIEVSPFSAAAARVNSPTSTVYGSAHELEDGRYHRGTIIHVVEHLEDDALIEMLGELKRASIAGAKYLVVTPDAGGKAQALHGDRWNAYRDPTHINLKDHSQWRDFFTSQGFTVLREGSDGMWNVPYSKLPRLLDGLRYSLPMAAQFLSRRLFLRPGTGESSMFVLSI